MDVTKPYKFLGFGAMDVTKPCKFLGFGAMDVTKPYKFLGFGAMDVTKPYKFIGCGRVFTGPVETWDSGIPRLGRSLLGWAGHLPDNLAD
jgi:hypothetical protein